MCQNVHGCDEAPDFNQRVRRVGIVVERWHNLRVAGVDGGDGVGEAPRCEVVPGARGCATERCLIVSYDNAPSDRREVHHMVVEWF